jgi:hypothetical protein
MRVNVPRTKNKSSAENKIEFFIVLIIVSKLRVK